MIELLTGFLVFILDILYEVKEAHGPVKPWQAFFVQVLFLYVIVKFLLWFRPSKITGPLGWGVEIETTKSKSNPVQKLLETVFSYIKSYMEKKISDSGDPIASLDASKLKRSSSCHVSLAYSRRDNLTCGQVRSHIFFTALSALAQDMQYFSATRDGRAMKDPAKAAIVGDVAVALSKVHYAVFYSLIVGNDDDIFTLNKLSSKKIPDLFRSCSSSVIDRMIEVGIPDVVTGTVLEWINVVSGPVSIALTVTGASFEGEPESKDGKNMCHFLDILYTYHSMFYSRLLSEARSMNGGWNGTIYKNMKVGSPAWRGNDDEIRSIADIDVTSIL